MASVFEADNNVQAIGTGPNGETAIFVLNDAPEAVAPYLERAGRAESVQIIKCSGFGIGPPYWPEPAEERSVDAPDYVDPKDRIRPVPGGVSIAHEEVTAGTVTFHVIDNLTGRMCVLSNHHVLVNPMDSAQVGDNILQPGPADGGTKPRDIYARLVRWVNIRQENISRFVDCAIAEPINPDEIDQNILNIGYPHGVVEPRIGLWVKKCGRTTVLTAGPIGYIEVDVKVNYGSFSRTIQRCFMTGCPGGPGDSGSGYLTYANEPVGILFAGGMVGDAAATIGCRMDLVEQLLDVTVPTPPEIQKRHGIDVSKWQGLMDWQSAHEAGIRVAMIRAGSIDNVTGIPYEDYQFRRNAEMAPPYMPVGFYWYFRPNHNAITQADYFCDLIQGTGWKAPPAIDVEEHGGKSTLEVLRAVQVFIERVNQKLDTETMIYSSPGFWNEYVARSEWAGQQPLWIANWVNIGVLTPLLPEDWKGKPGQPVMWQYRVAKGMGDDYGAQSPDIDMDVTYLSFEKLLAGETPPPPPDQATLAVTISGQGFVSPSGGQYPLGTVLQLIATPAAGWVFQGWGGEASGMDNPLSLTMDASKAITANFSPINGGPAEFVHHKGKVLAPKGLNIRTGPGTNYRVVGAMPNGFVVDILEEKKAGADTWARLGWGEPGVGQYAAMKYGGDELMRYVQEGEPAAGRLVFGLANISPDEAAG
jgi:GH25 family lysozyme M1 (1,4-beta-N-acetylmuramidase)